MICSNKQLYKLIKEIKNQTQVLIINTSGEDQNIEYSNIEIILIYFKGGSKC